MEYSLWLAIQGGAQRMFERSETSEEAFSWNFRSASSAVSMLILYDTHMNSGLSCAGRSALATVLSCLCNYVGQPTLSRNWYLVLRTKLALQTTRTTLPSAIFTYLLHMASRAVEIKWVVSGGCNVYSNS